MNHRANKSIDGKTLAHQIIENLKPDIATLGERGVVPKLAVIIIGDNPISLYAIREKEHAAKKAGIAFELHHHSKTPSYQSLAEELQRIDRDPKVHGIIIQRPLPPSISAASLTKRVSLVKDVDGFCEKSPFHPPVACAVMHMLSEIYFRKILGVQKPADDYSPEFIRWFKTKQVVLMGRGDIAGKPIANVLRKERIRFIQTNSSTDDPTEFTVKSDIIISAVGKPRVNTANMIGEGAI